MKEKALGGIGYSYIRFSTPEQMEGDSIRRQTDKTKKWCDDNGVTLDTATFQDLGKSAFKGHHLKDADKGGLAAFLALAQSKPRKIPAGSFLIVESLDRLDRRKVWTAAALIRDLIECDVRIVVLKPPMILDRDTDDMQVMMAIMELCRGNRESGRKQELIGDNWKNWRNTAAKSKVYRPGKRPFWLDREGDGYKLNDRANVVRLIYRLAGEGMGYIRIAKELRKKNIRPLAQSKHSNGWLSPAYLIHTLKNPSVYGRCEQLDSEDYFPPVITKEAWLKVQGVLAGRNTGGGRSGKNGSWVHLLKGLVQHRESGAVYYPHLPHKTKTKVYLTSDYKRGCNRDDGDTCKTPLTSFPVHAVEQAICACVLELDWQTMFATDTSADDGILALQGEMGILNKRIAEAQEALEQGELASLLPVLRKWEARLKSAKEELKQCESKAANPKTDLFKSAREVLRQLKGKDNAELRMKAASLIGRIVDRIEVEFQAKGKWRGAWCRVRFVDTTDYRDIYILYHKPHRTADGDTKDRLLWDTQRLKGSAEVTSEDAFGYLWDMAKDIDEERNEERRERKRLACKAWHAAKKG